jgi:hypothetical protein
MIAARRAMLHVAGFKVKDPSTPLLLGGKFGDVTTDVGGESLQ